MQFREYREVDYDRCEALVNQAWGFAKTFKPAGFADLVKCMYTRGSLLGSNYFYVATDQDKLVGFIFGLNEQAQQPKSHILYGLNILRRLFFLKGVAFSEKKALLKAANTHELNRSKIVKRGKSEINLFVVDPKYHGKGIGKQLLSGFVNYCRESGVHSMIVETNKLGASSFYEHVGFKHLGDFDSPIHEYATKGGQACMYELVIK